MMDDISIDYWYYNSFQNTTESDAVSGAYLFRPNESDVDPELYNTVKDFKIYSGRHVSLIRIIGDRVDSIISINNFSDLIKVETSLHGIPYTGQGMEVVLRIRSRAIKNIRKEFYTDSMGMELQQRILDKRPYWDLNVTQSVAGNYYPVNNMIMIQDYRRVLEVFNDRAQGGFGAFYGIVELMIQRRLYVDDLKGLFECLNETDPLSSDGRGVPVWQSTHFRIRGASHNEEINQTMFYIKDQLENPPYQLFTLNSSKISTSNKIVLTESFEVADGLKLLIFPESSDTIFLRVENYLDAQFYNQSLSVNITDIAEKFGNFANMIIFSITEMSLTGVFTMEEMSQKIKWSGEDYTSQPIDYSSNPDKVDLQPQRIRSFRVKYARGFKSKLKHLLK